MSKKNRRLFGLCAVLALGLTLLTACGGEKDNTSNTGNTNSGNMSGTSIVQTSSSNSTDVNSAMGSSSGMNANGSTGSSAACDQVTKVTITEHSTADKKDQYTFSPDHVTIKTGQFITFANQSDEIHVLAATPDAGLPESAIDRNEDQPVQFTKAGTYTLESQNAQHRGTMQVIVASATGITCGMSTPATTVTFTEKHTQGQPDAYALSPKTVSINAGQSIALLNKTSQALNFTCKPSTDIAEGNLRIDKDEQQVVSFAKAGQYACTSTETPAQTLAVTVH